MSPPVLIVEDHALVAFSLALALRAEGFHGIPCSDPAEDTVMAAVRRYRPRLVLLDLDLGERRQGADLVPRLRGEGCDILVVTGVRDEFQLSAAIAGGAIGWVPKHESFTDLVTAVVTAARGGPLLRPEERLLWETRYQAERERRELDRQRLERLSPRELTVLARLASGRRAETIAGELTVSLSTVRTQIRSILAKLDVTSQLEAAAIAHRAGAFVNFDDER